MDKDKTGLINAEELRDAIKTVGIKLGDSGHLNDIFA
jgi:Ca2+-binding EF-hand superfamily protein